MNQFLNFILLNFIITVSLSVLSASGPPTRTDPGYGGWTVEHGQLLEAEFNQKTRDYYNDNPQNSSDWNRMPTTNIHDHVSFVISDSYKKQYTEKETMDRVKSIIDNAAKSGSGTKADYAANVLKNASSDYVNVRVNNFAGACGYRECSGFVSVKENELIAKSLDSTASEAFTKAGNLALQRNQVPSKRFDLGAIELATAIKERAGGFSQKTRTQASHFLNTLVTEVYKGNVGKLDKKETAHLNKVRNALTQAGLAGSLLKDVPTSTLVKADLGKYSDVQLKEAIKLSTKNQSYVEAAATVSAITTLVDAKNYFIKSGQKSWYQTTINSVAAGLSIASLANPVTAATSLGLEGAKLDAAARTSALMDEVDKRFTPQQQQSFMNSLKKDIGQSKTGILQTSLALMAAVSSTKKGKPPFDVVRAMAEIEKKLGFTSGGRGLTGSMITKGDKVKYKGQILTLGNRLEAGLQSNVFRSVDGKYVIKVPLDDIPKKQRVQNAKQAVADINTLRQAGFPVPKADLIENGVIVQEFARGKTFNQLSAKAKKAATVNIEEKVSDAYDLDHKLKGVVDSGKSNFTFYADGRVRSWFDPTITRGQKW